MNWILSLTHMSLCFKTEHIRDRLSKNQVWGYNQEQQDPPMDERSAMIEAIRLLTDVLRQQQVQQ